MRLIALTAAAAAFAATAAAAPVTFDLTKPFFLTFDSATGETLTSDRGTSATMRAFAAAGNLQSTGTQDTFGAGTRSTLATNGDTVAVFGCADSGTSDCSALRFFFPTPVTLQSVTWNAFASDVGVRVFAGSAPVSAFASGTYPPGPPQVIDFTNQDPITELTIQARLSGSISIRAITVDDPTVAPIPLPAAAWLLIGGLGALGAVARKRAA